MVIDRIIRTGSRLVAASTLACLALLWWGATPAPGEQWIDYWGVDAGRINGSIALVVAAAAKFKSDDLPASSSIPIIDRFVFYPCDAPGCTEGKVLRLKYTGPTVLGDEKRIHYLVLDLPPGVYRLAEVGGIFRVGDKTYRFRFPVHYILQAREGRTLYLGRLDLTLRPTSTKFETEAETSGRNLPPLTFDFLLTNRFDDDGSALIQAHPDRPFHRMVAQPMVWLAPPK